MNNWFKRVDISLVSVREPEHIYTGKTNVLAQGHILNYDMLCCPINQEKSKVVQLNQLDINKQIYVELSFSNLSSLWSYLQDPNNINFIEGKRVFRD